MGTQRESYLSVSALQLCNAIGFVRCHCSLEFRGLHLIELHDAEKHSGTKGKTHESTKQHSEGSHALSFIFRCAFSGNGGNDIC